MRIIEFLSAGGPDIGEENGSYNQRAKNEIHLLSLEEARALKSWCRVREMALGIVNQK